MIQAVNISKSFGETYLYKDISLTIAEGQRIALIAKNGAGKSTLLNIIAGKESPDSGEIVFRNDISLGYLCQEPQLPLDKSVLEAIYHTDSNTMRAIKSYESALKSNDPDAIAEKAILMDSCNAWNIEYKIKSILTQLKITDLEQSVATLSGGQKKRLALAIVLIDDADVIILDEPTNHLDLEMSQWLEDYLNTCNKTIFMVTHDRYFLDNVCTDIYELDENIMFQYKGNYGDYILNREQRIEQFNTEIDKARNLYRKELEWMRRMPQARGTKAKYRKDAFYDIKDKAFEKRNDNNVEINITAQRLGTKIFEAKGLNKSFGNKKILSNFSYTFSRYEKLGIIGKNGTGKSTFLNILTGNISTDSGIVDVGSSVKFGYYKQSGIEFDSNAKVIDVARNIAEVVTMGDGSVISVSQFLTHFLFTPETQYNFINKLSGGELRRLYLLTILMQSPNFLILDEPTNDLDIMTLNVLEEYLENFGGCLIVVSHDRYFMDKVVDSLMVFDGDGAISMFAGNYTQYRNYVLEQQEKQRDIDRSATKSNSDTTPYKNTTRAKKISYKEKIEFDSLEKDIAAAEIEKQQIESLMNGDTSNVDDIVELSKRYSTLTEDIDVKTMRWLELSETYNI